MEEVTIRQPPAVDAYEVRERAQFLDKQIALYEGRLEEIETLRATCLGRIALFFNCGCCRSRSYHREVEGLRQRRSGINVEDALGSKNNVLGDQSFWQLLGLIFESEYIQKIRTSKFSLTLGSLPQKVSIRQVNSDVIDFTIFEGEVRNREDQSFVLDKGLLWCDESLEQFFVHLFDFYNDMVDRDIVVGDESLWQLLETADEGQLRHLLDILEGEHLLEQRILLSKKLSSNPGIEGKEP
jgi:hypothetical protein